ncbi:MAG: peptide-methionine (S)-S-oxide reductase MsrA [Caldilineaceae bacterium]
MSQSQSATALEVATLGGGCFWCLEAVYQEVRGVKSVVSGYAGGHVANPTYRQVGMGRTGHAEVVQITFDPTVVSFRQPRKVSTIHDPTTPNRQGADIGPQYRSMVLYHSDEQKQTTMDVIAKRVDCGPGLAGADCDGSAHGAKYSGRGLSPNYYHNNPGQGYCQVVIAPKVAKFRQEFLSGVGRAAVTRSWRLLKHLRSQQNSIAKVFRSCNFGRLHNCLPVEKFKTQFGLPATR